MNLEPTLKEQGQTFNHLSLGTTRQGLKKIKKYQRSPYIVVISGLRRAGKSTLLAQTARKFYPNNFYYVNFEDERLLNFQASEFSGLHETLVALFGEKKTFFLDEVQNVAGWERFVRRLADQGFKIYLTGSNASLLSDELGSKLTGRYLPIELLPFSFAEFLDFKKICLPAEKILTTVVRGNLKRAFHQYLSQGGIPDALKYPQLPVHKILYDDILHRDVASRFKIESLSALKELAFYLVSNVGSLISYNKLKDLLKLGSVNTVKSYVGFLEQSWLLQVVNAYAYSVKKQQIAPKKIYGIDTGLVKSVAFSFSENRGRFLENAVFLALRRKTKKIYYFRSAKGMEVDFYLPESRQLIQVCQNLDTDIVKTRELRALAVAAGQLGCSSGLVLTEDTEDEFTFHKIRVKIKPIFRWLGEDLPAST